MKNTVLYFFLQIVSKNLTKTLKTSYNLTNTLAEEV